MLALDVGPGFPASSWSFDGTVLTVIIARAYAPGAPISVGVSDGSSIRSISAKTIGSRRQPDGKFEVRMKTVSLTREQRVLLAGAT